MAKGFDRSSSWGC